jgi:hypothetical protein
VRARAVDRPQVVAGGGLRVASHVAVHDQLLWPAPATKGWPEESPHAHTDEIGKLGFPWAGEGGVAVDLGRWGRGEGRQMRRHSAAAAWSSGNGLPITAVHRSWAAFTTARESAANRPARTGAKLSSLRLGATCLISGAHSCHAGDKPSETASSSWRCHILAVCSTRTGPTCRTG